MAFLSDMDPEQAGKLFGIVVFIGAVLVYLLGRIVKGNKARGGR